VQQAVMVPGDFIQGKSAAPGGGGKYPGARSQESGGGLRGRMGCTGGVVGFGAGGYNVDRGVRGRF